VAIYEALDHYTPESFTAMDGVLEAFGRGRERYKQRDWAGAAQFFEAALSLNASDRPSKTHLERCRHFVSEPPPDHWDGVWVLTEK